MLIIRVSTHRAAIAAFAGFAITAHAATAPTSWHPASELVIAGNAEPGERLEITGRVLAREDSLPLAGVRVHAYHADARGRYSDRPGGPIRLEGDFTSGPGGLYDIRTVLPGLAEGVPHVHFMLLDGHGGQAPIILQLCRIHGAGTDSVYSRLPYFPALPASSPPAYWAPVEHAAERGFIVRWHMPAPRAYGVRPTPRAR